MIGKIFGETIKFEKNTFNAICAVGMIATNDRYKISFFFKGKVVPVFIRLKVD
jgi:hypothetical protein